MGKIRIKELSREEGFPGERHNIWKEKEYDSKACLGFCLLGYIYTPERPEKEV